MQNSTLPIFKSPLLLLSFLVFSLAASAQEQTTTPVITAIASKQNHADVIEALGTLKANHSVTITSTVSEPITAIHFTDGQQVKQGDLLISMDTADEEALLEEEQARLAEAQRQVDRLQPLAAQNATSKSAIDTQRSIVAVSQAKIKGIQTQLNKRRILAPFDGVIGLLDISVGNLAQPGNELATLDDIATMKMDFSVPERHLAALQQGVKIEALTQAFPGTVFRGEIAQVDTRINTNTRAVQVRAIIQNQDQTLKPGLLMRIKLLTEPRQSILIPEEAVISAGSVQSVFVIESIGKEFKVKKTIIQQGSRYDGKIEIIAGLSAGDEVVIHGTLRVQNGDSVEVIARKHDDETLSELLAQKIKPHVQGT